MHVRILHTNDMHGTLSYQRAEALREFRSSTDLYFDCGDAIRTGNLGIPLRPEAVWPLLEGLECTASVLGNRETHVLESAFNAKLAGAKHPILCANLRRKDGSRPLPRSLSVDVGDARVSVFGVMVPMVTERMKTKAASAFLWDPPLAVAREMIDELRPNCDLLIALTHIGHRQDIELAEACPELDVILGGHSHTVLQAPEVVAGVAICQTGSHSRFAGLYEWAPGRPLEGRLVPLPSA